jgi:hypothetical protein
MIAGLSDKKNGLKVDCADGNLMLCFGYKSVQRGVILENNIFLK